MLITKTRYAPKICSLKNNYYPLDQEYEAYGLSIVNFVLRK